MLLYTCETRPFTKPLLNGSTKYACLHLQIYLCFLPEFKRTFGKDLYPPTEQQNPNIATELFKLRDQVYAFERIHDQMIEIEIEIKKNVMSFFECTQESAPNMDQDVEEELIRNVLQPIRNEIQQHRAEFKDLLQLLIYAFLSFKIVDSDLRS